MSGSLSVASAASCISYQLHLLPVVSAISCICCHLYQLSVASAASCISYQLHLLAVMSGISCTRHYFYLLPSVSAIICICYHLYPPSIVSATICIRIICTVSAAICIRHHLFCYHQYPPSFVSATICIRHHLYLLPSVSAIIGICYHRHFYLPLLIEQYSCCPLQDTHLYYLYNTFPYELKRLYLYLYLPIYVQENIYFL